LAGGRGFGDGQASLTDLIELREGDARSLPFPDASFDAGETKP